VAVELAWFRSHLLDDLLPRWLAVAPHPNGFLQPHVDRQWRRATPTHATLVSQCRLIHNFAVGWELTGGGAYREAVAAGSDFLVRSFADARHGGWFWSVEPDGSPRERRKDTYGHAFAVFGLAHAHRCLADRRLLSHALETVEFLEAHLRDGEGGYWQGLSEDLLDPAPRDVRSQNPLMHLYEALLALESAGGGARAREAADRLRAFVLDRLLAEDGALPELFDAGWSPLDEARGGWINVGHQFEWAFLLGEAERMGHRPDSLSVARRLLEVGLSLGLDPADGGVRTTAMPDRRVRPEDAGHRGWWEQCEATRALMHFGLRRGEARWLGPLEANIAFFRKELIDPLHGGWFCESHPADPSKGNEWKIDYHAVGMCREAVGIADALSAGSRTGQGA